MKKLYLFIIINFMTTFAFADVSELNCTELGCGTAFPECRANKFEIRYYGGAEGVTGVEPTGPISCSYGTRCPAPENTYERTDYNFAGWDCKKSDGSSCNQNGVKYQPGDDISKATTTDGDTITLTASWTDSRNHIISYNGMGGSINAELVESCNNETETFDLPNAEQITRDNSSFLGWKLNGEGGYVTQSGKCDTDLEYVADWECDTGYQSNADGTACVAIEYSIGYELKGGNIDAEAVNGKKECDITTETFDLPNAEQMTRDNSSFLGWKLNGEGNYVTTISGADCTEDKIFVADWACNDGYAPNANNTACLGNIITITLDNAFATTDGTDILYGRIGSSYPFLDSALTERLSPSSNPIAIPAKQSVFTFNTNGGSVDFSGSTFTPIARVSDNVATFAPSAFMGYYSAISGGTQYVDGEGYITSDGMNALESATGDLTWYAQWNPSALTITRVPGAVREGFNFSSWTVELDNYDQAGTRIVNVGQTTSFPASATFTANYTPITYTVTLDTQGGTGGTSVFYYQFQTMDPCMYYSSADLSACTDASGTKLTIPTRTGYTFGGYYTAENGGGEEHVTADGMIKPYLYVVPEDTTLYAKWTANCNPVYLNTTNGTAGDLATVYKRTDDPDWFTDSTCSAPITKEAFAELVPTRSGYTFRGFYASEESDIAADTAGDPCLLADGYASDSWYVNGRTNLYASWVQNCEDPQNGSCSSIYIAQDGSTVDYTATCDTGYTVGGADTATPTCTANTYDVSYAANDGSGSAPTSPTSCTYDLDCTAPANTYTRTGYTFAGWKCTGGTTSACDGNIIDAGGSLKNVSTGSEITLTAQWTAKTYTCEAGEYLNGDVCARCTAGSYCTGGSYTYNGQIQGMVTCGANSYSNAGASECIQCATGYTNSDDHVGIASCKITCPAGQYVAEAGKGCVSVEIGYYGLGGTVGQDGILEREQCPDGYREGPAATKESDCMGSCTELCEQKTCPDNSTDCVHGNEFDTGTKTYGDKECSVTAPECSMTFNCKTGYNKVDESCIAGDMNVITYNTDGGNINGTKTDSCNVESSTIVLPTDVTKTGYTFDGWYDANGEKVEQIEQGSCLAAIALTARWTPCEPCNAGTGASCELSVVNNQCRYTTKCADNYYNEQDVGTPTPSCETCVKSCSGNTDGFVLGEYNVCKGGTAELCYRNCVVSDVSNAYAVSGTLAANGTSSCMATSCVSNSYLSGGNCTSCDSGYTAPNNNTGDQSSCTKSCELLCSGEASCPSNATCEYDKTYKTSGTQVQGGECPATAVVCPIASFQCESGYRETSDGKSCERSDYYITYNMGGGQNYANAPTVYTVGVGITIEGTPTYAGYVFEGWCLDEGKTKCNDRVVISEDAAKDISVWAKWSQCTNGYYCNGVQNKCPDTHPYSNSGSDTESDCYAKCEPMTGGDYTIIYPAQDTVNHPAICDYNTEVRCIPGYQMVNDKCTACPYDKNAVTYSDGCKIDSCAFGYHPNGSVCDSDKIDCVAPNGLRAQQEWDRVKKAYGICKIVECADDYRLVDNVCLPNTEVCTLANGVGIREWDYNKNKWGACIATSCNPGYTNDRSMTNEIWLQCGRCNNAYGKDGKQAVSSYVRECEIASCMYQGELYTLENNECRLICDEYSDETGRRYWDSSRKKCMHECAPGFIKW